MQEGKENSVDRIIEDPRIIELPFTFDYHDTGTKLAPLVCIAKIYEAAEFYVIPKLKKLAQQNFYAAAISFWMTRPFLDGIGWVYAHDPFSGDPGEELKTIVLKLLLGIFMSWSTHRCLPTQQTRR